MHGFGFGYDCGLCCECQVVENTYLVSTEVALKLPTTYANHPTHPSVQHIALNELNRPKIDLSQPSMTSND